MISVCMATYNGEKYIKEQLDSVLACLSDEDEIIISDDGSDDGTLPIIEEYKNKHVVTIGLFKGPGRGVIPNFDNAIAHSHGDYIFLCDQDDVWHCDKVKKVIAAFKTENCDLVVHDARLVDSNGIPMGQTLYGLRQSKPGFLKNIVKNSYVGCCMALRRDLVAKVLPIPENVEMHDWWIGMVSDMTSRSVFIDEQLIDYRRHGGNASRMHHYPIPKMVSIRVVMLAELLKRRMTLRAGVK